MGDSAKLHQVSGSNSEPAVAQKLATYLPQIELVLNDQTQYARLLEQTGEMAQTLLDLLQTLSDYPNITPTLRSKILSAMIYLSKRSGLYPNCLVLNDVRKVGDHPVAAGGFGEIWKGLIGGQIACLKVVKIYGDSDVQKLLKDFVREAILWRQLDHPNVLPFLGLYFLDDSRQRVCLISPWMHNGNLRQYLNNHSDSSINRARLAHDIACGLEYLHGRKIVHGDLKGENILITLADRAAIADFGLARKVAESDDLRLASLSTSNLGKGSLRWLAPECLLQGEKSTFNSDIYAFGCICYETFTARIPFYEYPQDVSIIFQLSVGKRPTRPPSVQLNDATWKVMQDCWSQEPTARPKARNLPSQIALTTDIPSELADDWDISLSHKLWRSVSHPEIHLDGSRLEAFLFGPRLQSAGRANDFTSSVNINNISDPLSIVRITTNSDPQPQSRPVRPLPPIPTAGPAHLNSDYLEQLRWGMELDRSGERSFADFSLLSHIAIHLKDNLPRANHVVGGTLFSKTFTGKDILSIIGPLVQGKILAGHNSLTDHIILQVARTLQSQLFFYEVGASGRALQDDVEDIYIFLNDEDSPSEAVDEFTELPTGVVTVLTSCYSPDCVEYGPCYSPRCPRKSRE